ncbi:MAG: Rne/Rng family ribonuclease [Saprospiraceae bacterium]
MEKELVINSHDNSVDIALLEDSKLVELHQEELDNAFNVGDVFLGFVKRLMPGLNAAFIEIGHPKDAFLHYTDCGPQLSSVLKYTDLIVKKKVNTSKLDNFLIPPEIDKNGKIDKVLRNRQPILVQVLKEPISTKGPRLTCEITIPGRFVVLTPFSNVVAVSKKIGSSEERQRLKNLVESIKPKNFGVIVRTAAEGKKVAGLHEDISQLSRKWDEIYKKLYGANKYVKVLSELDKSVTMLRDVMNDSFNRIVVNDPEMHANIKHYLGGVAKDKLKILNLHKGKRPLFDQFGISRQIKASFGKSPTMKSGAYLVIEHTEAMHVIDVNSGPKIKKTDQETSAISVNLEAAEEIARQLRLRDLGGLIIIDFIDMRNAENKTKLVKVMKKQMSMDRAQHTILPLSKFGLMQITRQRTRPEININTSEKCPSCSGSGRVSPTILITDDVERKAKLIIDSGSKSKFAIHCHPFISTYLKSGFPSIRMKWFQKFGRWIKIIPNQTYGVNEYKFFNQNEDEIRID